MTFISINALGKAFGDFQALRDVSLEIEKGQFVTLLGPSGCGKTTTLRLVAGLLTPDAGTIDVGGTRLSGPGFAMPPENRNMGMVFQSYAVWPHLSLFDNVAFGLRLRKMSRRETTQAVERVLEIVGLAGLEDRNPSQLSGGQQQRVALARSLVIEPSILLLDEPLSNLDAKLREKMRDELKALQRRTGITFLYVTHDQAEAMALSDRIVAFHGGKVQQIGSPRDLYERPANLFVADFMGLVNRMDGAVIGAEGDVLKVRAGGVEWLARRGDVAAIGAGPVTMVVRPEAIRIAQSMTGAPRNTVSGVLRDSTYLGNIVDHRFEIGSQTLRVQGDRSLELPVGTRVDLAIAIEDCIVLSSSTPS